MPGRYGLAGNVRRDVLWWCGTQVRDSTPKACCFPHILTAEPHLDQTLASAGSLLPQLRTQPICLADSFPVWGPLSRKLGCRRSRDGRSTGFGGLNISAYGRYVGFESASTNLVPMDTNVEWDAFVALNPLFRHNDRMSKSLTRLILSRATWRFSDPLMPSTPVGPYAEGAHIRPLGRLHDGPDVTENVLCLCPNHHALFGMGSFAISDNSQLINIDGPLTLRPDHLVDVEHVRYHRGLKGLWLGHGHGVGQATLCWCRRIRHPVAHD